MFTTADAPPTGSPKFSKLASENFAPKLTGLLLVLAAALVAVACGSSALAPGGQISNTFQIFKLARTLPVGVTGQSYHGMLNVSGRQDPYHFAIKSGSLPPGLTLNPLTGLIHGTPLVAGTHTFQVVVTDGPRREVAPPFSLRVFSEGSPEYVAVSPATVTLAANQKQRFFAVVGGTPNTGVTWSATAGSIDSSGLYTAPAASTSTNVTVTAVSNADSSHSASAIVTLEGATTSQSPAITTAGLAQGQVGISYQQGLSASGGTQPYAWHILSGSLPTGVSLSSDGQLSGIPTAAGTFNFTASVTDSQYLSAQQPFSVAVTSSVTSSGNFDGPAELPRVTMSTSLARTPAPGKTIPVNTGDNLQLALNNAGCGDTLALQAGATFTGTFQFPARPCDDNRWIVVRTSAPDGALPPEGQRITPCYAGVASLFGRPQYACSNPQNVMARIVVNNSQVGPISFDSGANHYRLIGLEITRAAGFNGAPTLLGAVQHGTADHIVIDRSWVHGTTQDDTRAGFFLSGVAYAAVIDSYFNDFHCTAGTGACTDSHTILGGTGDYQDGPYQIENNFLEASGEGLLFGGGPATTTPTDIVIRRNHFFKPLQWTPGNPNFVGGVSGNPFVVKNHFELKNAARVLVEGNLMENVWGGFTQTGFAILLTPKNQHQRQTGNNVCPSCQVSDVTIRYTRISHAGGGIAISTDIALRVGGAPASAGTRFSIHDLVIDDISKKYIGGFGRLFFLANGWPTNPLNTVTINHITGFADADGGILFVGNNLSNPPMYGFVFTNNLVTTGRYPVWNSGRDTSCAASAVPVTIISKCFTTYTFNNNALLAVPSAYPPSSWPAGNVYAPNVNNAGFVEYSDGNGGNYELQSGSPYRNMGSDGKDLGADIVGLNALLANVE